MPTSERTQAAARIIEDASSSLSDLVKEMAEPLAELMLESYTQDGGSAACLFAFDLLRHQSAGIADTDPGAA